MLYLRKLEGITFYFSVFLISIQLGKHFWPNFAFVQGIRIDYLSPTLYLSDIFILLFIVLHIFNNFSAFFKLISKSIILPLFLISILISSFYAQNFDTSVYWSLKIIEIILFGLCIANYSLSKKRIYTLVDVVVIAAILQSIIAFFQFVFQGSLGGLLYFLGERSFNVDTIGISTFFTNGKEILRAYGTFPHPNVLALFLSISLIFLLYIILKEKTGKRVYFYILSFMPIFLALLLTASRIIILLTIIITLLSFVKSKKHFFYAIMGLFIVIPLYLLIFSGRFLTLSSLIDAFNVRVAFISSSISIIRNNFLFGVGLNNTFFETEIIKNLPIYVRFQPVHNIYLHILSQVGIFGGVFIGVFLFKILHRAIKLGSDRNSFLFIVSFLVLQVLIVGLFDHFLVTLQQGMLMSALLIGLLFNKSMESV